MAPDAQHRTAAPGGVRGRQSLASLQGQDRRAERVRLVVPAMRGRGPDPRAGAAGAGQEPRDASSASPTWTIRATLRQFVHQHAHHLSGRCATSTGTSCKSFGTDGVPETFVINRQGRIVALRRYQLAGNWLQQTVSSNPDPAGMTRIARRVSRASSLLALTAGAASPAPAAASAATTPRASLTDIENDVMCDGVPRTAGRGELAAGRLGARVHPRADRQGLTKSQIEQKLVAQYGLSVLGKPPRTGST